MRTSSTCVVALIASLSALVIVACGRSDSDDSDSLTGGSAGWDGGVAGKAGKGGSPPTTGGSAGAPPAGGSSGGGGMAGGGGTAGGGGAGGVAGGTGGVAGAAGTGGEPPQCSTAADCPVPANDCIYRECVAGQCKEGYVTAGKALVSQPAGDCQTAVCDGKGGVSQDANAADIPEDSNPCTQDLCEGSSPVHVNQPSGMVCGDSVMCDGQGACVGCVVASDCPGDDNDCQTRTCDSTVCGFAYQPAGTHLPQQVSGDCRAVQCNGSGQSEVVDDAADLPAADVCMTASCEGGIPNVVPSGAGSPCDQKGTVCDGAGDCVECLVAGDCGQETECKKFACTAGSKCDETDLAKGTLLAQQTPGNCLAEQCDGNGGVESVASPTDPQDDSNPCTSDTCTSAGTTVHPPVPTGTPCDSSGGVCSATGQCGAVPSWDPATAGADIELSNGNLTVSGTSATCAGGIDATGSKSSGKWYWEARAQQDKGSHADSCPVLNGIHDKVTGKTLVWYGRYGSFVHSNGLTCSGNAVGVNSGDVVGMAWDADAGTLKYLKNGVLIFDCAVPTGTYFPYANHCNDAQYHCESTANFGAAPFAYPPPAGYSAIY